MSSVEWFFENAEKGLKKLLTLEMTWDELLCSVAWLVAKKNAKDALIELIDISEGMLSLMEMIKEASK
jgi:hypothetical protein